MINLPLSSEVPACSSPFPLVGEIARAPADVRVLPLPQRPASLSEEGLLFLLARVALGQPAGRPTPRPWRPPRPLLPDEGSAVSPSWVIEGIGGQMCVCVCVCERVGEGGRTGKKMCSVDEKEKQKHMESDLPLSLEMPLFLPPFLVLVQPITCLLLAPADALRRRVPVLFLAENSITLSERAPSSSVYEWQSMGASKKAVHSSNCVGVCVCVCVCVECVYVYEGVWM